jgi:putative transposase
VKARYRYRFYPTDQQQQSLAQLFGCVRVVWNDALAACRDSKFPGFNSLCKTLTLSKKMVDREWLNDVSSVALQQSLKQLDVAYQNFFNSSKGKRKGRQVGQPRFKKKMGTQTATLTKAAFSMSGKSVYLAKVGDVNPIWSRDLPSDPSSVTIIKDAANRYFLSFVVEVERVQTPAQFPSIGIDLGIKTFAALSSGEMIKAPDYSRLDRKIRRAQKRFARQLKGSNRRAKTKLQIAKLHNQLSDTRSDFMHKLSTRVAIENQVVALEDLNVSGMVKNRKLARVISLQGWREFRELTEAKTDKFSRQFVVINRWEPTSQVCSDCGFKWGKLDLKIRTVVCLNCGSTHDRDENAAINIQKVGIGHCHDSKRTMREGKTGFACTSLRSVKNHRSFRTVSMSTSNS